MNTLFIDIETKVKSKEKIKSNTNINNLYKYSVLNNLLFKMLKFNIIEDNIEKGLFNSIKYLKIDEELLGTTKKSGKFRKYILQKIIKYNFSKIEELNLVFSNTFDNNVESKKCIKDMLSCNKNIKLIEINSKNEMHKNDIVHIEKYISEKNISKNKLKILVIIDNICDSNHNKILEYISRYKIVDILRTNNISKVDYKKLQEDISKINEENGTSIQILQRRNITQYDIYILFSNIDKNYFTEHYILKKKCSVIDMNNPDLDFLQKGTIEYLKNKQYIDTIFFRLGINGKKFSKNKLGHFIILKDKN